MKVVDLFLLDLNIAYSILHTFLVGAIESPGLVNSVVQCNMPIHAKEH